MLTLINYSICKYLLISIILALYSNCIIYEDGKQLEASAKYYKSKIASYENGRYGLQFNYDTFGYFLTINRMINTKLMPVFQIDLNTIIIGCKFYPYQSVINQEIFMFFELNKRYYNLRDSRVVKGLESLYYILYMLYGNKTEGDQYFIDNILNQEYKQLNLSLSDHDSERIEYLNNVPPFYHTTYSLLENEIITLQALGFSTINTELLLDLKQFIEERLRNNKNKEIARLTSFYELITISKYLKLAELVILKSVILDKEDKEYIIK